MPNNRGMEHISPVEKAIQIVGGSTALARLLGVTPPTVHEWKVGKRPVPIERCLAIERATSGAVTRLDLRPNDYLEIWPELAAEQAPRPFGKQPEAVLTTDPILAADLNKAEQAGLVTLPKKATAWNGVERRQLVRRTVDRERLGLDIGSAGQGV